MTKPYETSGYGISNGGNWLFSELNTSADLFFKKKYQNNKMDQLYRKPDTFINITCVC